MHNEDHSHHHLHFNYRNNHNGTDAFCLPWNSKDAHNRTHQPFDLWWTHHPTYVISNETDDTFCVEPSTDYERNEAFQRFYDTQFDTGCDEIQWRVMWSSGWGADMMNVQVIYYMMCNYSRLDVAFCLLYVRVSDFFFSIVQQYMCSLA